MTGIAAAIGNFDGVHLGHASLMRKAIEVAGESGLKPCVITFDPHPLQVVAPERAPRPLGSMEQRIQQIRALGIEEVIILPFTQEFSRMSAAEFAASTLQGLNVKAVVVGENFRFGHKHAGDVQLLRALGEKHGFGVHVCAPVRLRDAIVSSSEVRERIATGSVSRAARMLGRWYAIEGEVVRGHGIGAKQTVPTLNLEPPAQLLPADGVYATHTTDLERGTHWNSVTNVGLRPTFGGTSRTVETFLLGDLVDSPTKIRVEFLARLRPERTFPNPEALRQQIFKDVSRAKRLFRYYG